MPIIFRVKLGKTGKSLRITIPKPIAEGFEWKEGDEIELVVNEHEIMLRRAKEAPRSSKESDSRQGG